MLHDEPASGEGMQSSNKSVPLFLGMSFADTAHCASITIVIMRLVAEYTDFFLPEYFSGFLFRLV